MKISKYVNIAGASIFAFALVIISRARHGSVEMISRGEKVRELSKFSLANPQSLVKSDGYISASAYRQALKSSAAKGQEAYIKNWKSKNLAEAHSAVKAAATLYNKWAVVDPYTGVSKDNLEPFSSWGKVYSVL